MKTKTYSQIYNEATEKMVKVANIIHSIYNLNVEYTLPQITYALREMYKNLDIRKQFVGSAALEDAWSKGFCGLGCVEIFKRYGEYIVWDFATIDSSLWTGGAVKFLLEKSQKIPFGTVGEYYYPLSIPYELGVVRHIPKLMTTSTNYEFSKLLDEQLGRI